jgi:hypothetical protein
VSERIRRAAPADVGEITAMIHAMAEFERAADQRTITETQILAALFGRTARLGRTVAEMDG